jgi:hypothetical protein
MSKAAAVADEKASLLSLSDETLQRIEYFRNDDNFIPLPSFRDYWASSVASEINGNLAGALSFRGVCSRTLHAIPVKGLHLVVTNTKQLERWAKDAPDIIISAIRRVFPSAIA